MPGLTPTRTEISDRFSVLGFRVRSGRNPYFEVAIATDPSLFHADAKAQRSAANFFSSHSTGPLLAEHGEAMEIARVVDGRRADRRQRLEEAEVDAARTSGFAIVSLGPFILRTETVAAAVLGAALLLPPARNP